MHAVKGQMLRSPSQESHRVFVFLEGKGWKLGAMNCLSGFKINRENANLLEVREGDVVKLLIVKPETIGDKSNADATGVKKFLLNKNKVPTDKVVNVVPENSQGIFGTVKKPTAEELELGCDFVLGDKLGNRYRIALHLQKNEEKEKSEKQSLP